MKVLLLSSLVGLSAATPQFFGAGPGFGPGPAHHLARPHHAPAPLHHPAPAPYHPAPKHHDPYKIPPRPYAYEFGVQDAYSGADFAKKEVQDDHGVVTGEYRVALPDGRIQIVTYHADHVAGYTADVRYEGTPVYPEPHHGGPAPYRKPAPYAPRPVHHAAPLHHAPAHHAAPHHFG